VLGLVSGLIADASDILANHDQPSSPTPLVHVTTITIPEAVAAVVCSIHRLANQANRASPECRICGGRTQSVGIVHGRFSGRDYGLARCPSCGFAFVVDPWLDFETIYDRSYYAGQGADPLVDYLFELDQPELTIRQYEWHGIATMVQKLLGSNDPSRPSQDAESASVGRWLDFGCGAGGLVRYLRERGVAEAFGFDESPITEQVRRHGIPVLSDEELLAQAGSFDVVSAIEVLEHTLDPVAELRKMRDLLRPGGLLLLTTGNAQPHAKQLTRWRYVLPEIHISFFEPRTLERALAAAGFRPERRSLGSGFDEVLKFKVLKNLRIRRRSRFTDVLPSSLIGPTADRITKLGEHPVGWAV
jgi:SAM-dependent methyltransferase